MLKEEGQPGRRRPSRPMWWKRGGWPPETLTLTTLLLGLDHGAPLGFVEEIPSLEVFPTVDGPEWSEEQALSTFRTMDGWQNYQSAEEEKEDLCKLIEDYTARGFCHMVKTMEEAEEELGRKPHLNKLGVVVKFNEQGVKKSRIIWDLKESGANAQRNQGERIILPRLLDLASGALKAFRMGKEPGWLRSTSRTPS